MWKDAYSEVNDAFKELEDIHDKYVAVLTDDGHIGEAEQYIAKVECDVKDCLSKIYKLEKEGESKVKIKVKALEPPRFTGELRDFPDFKDDFTRIVEENYGKDPFALKQCLGGEALKSIAGCENDYEAMFKRLDEQFGDPRKIVDVVIGDLKTIKTINDGDNKGFVKMVGKVEQCWLDLKRVNLESEMNTAHVVSMIEKTLPTLQKREWVMKASAVSGTDQLFPDLLKFLLKEKQTLEYMDSNVRCSAVNRNVNSVAGFSDNINNDYDIVHAIKNIQMTQENRNKEFEKHIVNLTEAVRQIKTGNQSGGKMCWLHNVEGHNIYECDRFKALDNAARIEAVRTRGICFKCIGGNHLARKCIYGKSCDIKLSDRVCNRNHHPLLHDALNQIGDEFNVAICKGNGTLLAMGAAHCNGRPVSILYDSGSDVTLIRHQRARELGIRGRNIKMTMVKVGNVKEHFSTREYILPLQDKCGNIVQLRAIGNDEISAKIAKIETSNVVRVFTGITVEDIKRPEGHIDILIGTDYCELLPEVVQTRDKLQLLKNPFGYCIRGSHPLIPQTSSNVGHITIRTNHIAGNFQINQLVSDLKDDLSDSLNKFFTLENMGTECKPKCPKCLCRNCPDSDHSMKDERELALIEDGLKYDVEREEWTASYPWLKDPRELKNNVRAAVARMKSLEVRLKRLGSDYAQKYQNEINDMKGRNIARKLSEEEIQSHEGPIHYIHHHEVIKPGSASTPLRIVFNSSANHMGQCLNDWWAKGPDVVNNLCGVLLRFRQNQVAVTGDIGKMYHSVKLGSLEQHTHRFVLTSVTFGDKCSAAIATLAMRKTAEMFKESFPRVNEIINKNSYVDDILFSKDSESEVNEDIRNVEKVLKQGGFHIKHWIVSGNIDHDDSVKILDSNREKVLGMQWDPKNDELLFKIRVNFSQKFRKIRSGPDMSREDCENSFPSILTRRMILSQVASIYDPLGLVLPVTLKAKIMMRTLISREDTHGRMTDKGSMGWDEPLLKEDAKHWKEFFCELFDMEHLRFQRCLKPRGAIGNPTLVIFSDGGLMAYGACAYIRWELECGGYTVSLIAAKNRIAPIRQVTIPRLELCGAVLATRLRKTIEKEVDWEFDSVFHIIDSTIVRSDSKGNLRVQHICGH